MKVEAIVKPDLLVWARESSGLSQAEAADKAQVALERIAAWEIGVARPSIHQLRKLAGVYKRPLAVFYLPERPRDFQAMHDYRRLPGEVAGHESPKLRFEIRKARYRRQIALELLSALGEQAPKFSYEASLIDDAESMAGWARTALGVSHEQQTAWATPFEALNGWRSAIEKIGVLVFQTTDVEVSEVRGFSLGESALPVVVVNNKDHPHGRIFTMLHEFAHLMLRREGLCDLIEDSPRLPDEQQIEILCNRVAAATLMPRDQLLGEPAVGRQRYLDGWGDDEIAELAVTYRVSREALLRRLLVLGKTTAGFYRRKRQQFSEEFAENERKRRDQPKKGGPAPDRVAVSTSGPTFVRLVLDSFYQEKITSSDVSDYLGVRLKWMPKIEQAVFGRTQDVWAFA